MEKQSQTLLEIVHHIIIQHPELVRSIRDLAQQRLTDLEIQTLSAKEVFTKIYSENLWGNSGSHEQPFYSGAGSHVKEITSAYVQAVSHFIQSLGGKPNALDLGCGDFNVGSQIRPYCNRYIACDIVSDLIQFNQNKFAELDVDFRVLDLIEDPLPATDIVFVRQVLQHLSNSQIQKFLPKLKGHFSWLILTEHIPAKPDFPHNLDHTNSQHIRLSNNSGIVITSPPFNLESVEEKVLCQVASGTGVVKTIAYRLK